MTAPTIFWASSPVLPNETILLTGDAFGANAQVELGGLTDGDWFPADVLQSGPQSLKALIPITARPGVFRCRVRVGDALSNEVTLNAPAPWWQIGDGGKFATVGGWLRVFGNCLAFDEPSLRLEQAGTATVLGVEESSMYALKAALPDDLAAGRYVVSVHNGFGDEAGWRSVGEIEIVAKRSDTERLINVLDFGADPEGKEDCTLSIVQATERAMGIGGGVVYFPAGRYRIDSILRSGMYIRHPLRVPRGVTLRGAGADLVSLWWPDQAEPLPSLIEGGDDFAIEDLSLYTQGRHRNIISGESGVKVRRVRIRANCYYMTGDQGRPHHLRSVDESPSAMGFAVELSGDNNEVTDCDIYTSNACFSIKHCHHAVVARNTVRASNLVFISGGSEIVFERNTFEGNRLAAGGNNIALHFGASDCRHVYYAHNTVAHIYGGDHEALTFDGHGTAYLGRVKDSEPGAFTLLAPAVTGTGERDAMATLHDATAYILAGRGAGQYRRVRSVIGERVTLEEPWLVAPDATSILSIGGFNGRHLIIGNTAQDTGAAVQLYPPNCECIVAENRAIHASNINIVGKLGINTGSRFPRAEASWYNQILDNHVVHGNGWGGGETEIDRWLGGECMLNIWGWEVQFYCDEHGSDQDKYLSHADLASLPGGAGKEAVAVPISRAHVVRRHLIDNNSSIRVRGAATDVLIEHCRIADSARGVRIDDELPQEHDPGLNQLRTTKETVRRSGSDPYLTPKGVLVRGTQFTNVNLPLSGTALPDATVLD